MIRTIAAVAALAAFPFVALADDTAGQSCPARIVADCSAPPPAPGQAFAGPVLQVLDGQTLCVALGPTPNQWVRVRLADGRPTDTRRELMAAVFAQVVQCMPLQRESEGVAAVCLSDGVPVPLAAEEPDIRAKLHRSPRPAVTAVSAAL